MARPIKGAVRWVDAKSLWEVRFTLANGARSRPMVLLRGHPCARNASNPARDCDCAPCLFAKGKGREAAVEARAGGLVDNLVTEETSNEWHVRYQAVHAGLKHETRGMGSWNKWCARIGTLLMAEIKTDDVKAIRGGLRQAFLAETISAKRCMNLWSELITAPFSRAFTDDDADYETVHVGPANKNPALGVKPPVSKKEIDEDERERQALFPRDFVKLISCEAIPLAWRRLYAVAVSLYVRPEELYALNWTDVDWEAHEVRVRIALDLKTGEEKPTKTKAGRRSVPIGAPLMPLLAQMKLEAGSHTGRIFQLTGAVRDVEKNVARLRAHLEQAGVDRLDLLKGSDVLKPFDFRSLRTTGITWLAMLGTDSSVIALYAGHDKPEVSWAHYIKQGPDLRRRYGEPFPPLDALVAPPHQGFGEGFGVLPESLPKTPSNQCEGGDLNPYASRR